MESCPTQGVLPLDQTRGGQSHPRPVYTLIQLCYKGNGPGRVHAPHERAEPATEERYGTSTTMQFAVGNVLFPRPRRRRAR
ncbi:MAG: hypothetical protein ACQESR_05715 [Planctomycetota bacterium]